MRLLRLMEMVTLVLYFDVSANKLNASVADYNTTDCVTSGGNKIIGLVKPIMWDPQGTYPSHIVIPNASPNAKRQAVLGDSWDDLLAIIPEGILRNSGMVSSQVCYTTMVIKMLVEMK